MRERVTRFVKALFGSSDKPGDWQDEATGGVGVREPRRPLAPTSSGAVALDPPGDDEPS